MSKIIVQHISLPELSLWGKTKGKNALISFDLEITARCNNGCRHCYINLPAGDSAAKEAELSLEEIVGIADEAVSLGALWCLITGGEPLLREDFPDIYLALKRKGLLVSVFTNATLITEEHVSLFRKYPPRDIEVSVYGVTEKTYAQVTQRSGLFTAFNRGVNLLLESGIKVRFKAMALRSNLHEMPEIARFCRERTKDYFRFDPLLHLRYDGDPARNEEIKSERLSPEEIVELEYSDPERRQAMEEHCQKFILQPPAGSINDRLFNCGAGIGSFTLSYDGIFRLCSSLWHPDCIYDLKSGNLADAWHNLVPLVRSMRSDRKQVLENCLVCPVINLCLWCPAHAYLETGEMDVRVDEFCKVAHARVTGVEQRKS